MGMEFQWATTSSMIGWYESTGLFNVLGGVNLGYERGGPENKNKP